MAFPITPSRRVRQPQGAARLTYAGIDAGVVAAVGLGAGPLHDAASGRLLSSTDISYVPSKYGMAAYFNGTSSFSTMPLNLAGVSRVSVLMLANFTSLHTSSGADAFINHDSGGTAGFSYYNTGSNDNVISHNSNPNSLTRYYSGIRPATQVWNSFAYYSLFDETDAANELQLYINGSPITFYSLGGGALDNATKHVNGTLELFSHASGTANWTNGLLGSLLVFNRYVPPAEANEYFQNPFSLAVPDPRRVYFDLGRPKGTMRPTVRV